MLRDSLRDFITCIYHIVEYSVADPYPECEKIRYGSKSWANFETDPDPGKNDTGMDPDPGKND